MADLIAYFQFLRELRRLKHIATQLIAHRQDDSRVREGEEKWEVDDSPNHEWDVPREDRAEDHAATNNQRPLPVATLPDGKCGIYRKDKEQHQTNIAKQTP